MAEPVAGELLEDPGAVEVGGRWGANVALTGEISRCRSQVSTKMRAAK
jgi:hypothetical protein